MQHVVNISTPDDVMPSHAALVAGKVCFARSHTANNGAESPNIKDVAPIGGGSEYTECRFLDLPALGLANKIWYYTCLFSVEERAHGIEGAAHRMRRCFDRVKRFKDLPAKKRRKRKRQPTKA